MKLLIFDTETTGLPTRREPASKGPNNWPHIVSISWIVLDTDTNIELTHKSYIVRPDNWYIPVESTRIHGITHEEAATQGTPLITVMNAFLTEPCDAWVAHNLEFDLGVIINAVLWDIKSQFPKVPQRKYCTMLLGKGICKLPGRYGYKPPKLKELYCHAFGKYPEELLLHNSMYDVRILTEIIKSYLPLRQAMGLVARSISNTDGVQKGRTLTICIRHADGEYKSDSDLGE
jgi:DNA polymerase III epsilon subunit-like protein